MFVSLQIFGVYDLALAIVGTLSNLLVLAVAYRLRRTTTFVFIACLAVTDSLTLYFWNLNHFTRPFYNLDIESVSSMACKFINFLQFVSLQSSAWLLVLLSFDRLMSILLKQWKIVYFKPKHALALSFLTIIVIFFLNFNMFFTFGYEQIVNGTNGTVEIIPLCFDPASPALDWMNIWSVVHSAMYSYVPFSLLSIINIILLISLKRSGRVRVRKSSSVTLPSKNKKRKSNVNTLVISITLVFIIMTLPGTIASIYFSQLLGSELGLIIIVLCDSLEFSYHGLSILILIFTNKKFTTELKNVIMRRKQTEFGMSQSQVPTLLL